MPALHLRIGRSRILHRLRSALYLSVVAVSALLACRGAHLAALYSLLVLPLLHRRTKESLEGRELSWRDNTWFIETRGQSVRLAPVAPPTLLPWLVYVSFAPTAGAQHRHRFDLWLFPDAVTRDQWRALRVRLTVSTNEDRYSGELLGTRTVSRASSSRSG